MDSEFYVNNDDIIETYYINIDENKLKEAQLKVDEIYGMGPLKKAVKNDFSFNVEISDKRVLIVSKKFIEKGQIFDESCEQFIDVDVYEYQYYSFFQSVLSEICDQLLNFYGKIDLSFVIKKLLNYELTNEKDMEAIKLIMDCIQIEKVNYDKIIKSDLSEDKKEKLLKRIIKAIRNEKDKPLIIVHSEDYDKAVETELFRRRKNGSRFVDYSEEEKKEIKRKILKELPNKDEFKRKK